MKEVFWGTNLKELMDEMFAHVRTQIENLALVNSSFVFD